MPFLRIRLDAVERLAAMDRQLEDTITELNRPGDVIRRLVGLMEEKGWRNSVRKIWAVLLFFLLFASWIALLILQSWCFLIFVTCGLTSHFLLISWNSAEKMHLKALMCASNGAGIVRQSRKLQSITNFSFSTVALFLSFVVVLQLLSVLGLVPIFPQPTPHLSLQLLISFGITLSAVLFPAANSVFFSYLARISEEYEALSYDFRHDINAYQLSVCRHYLFAHRALYRTISPIRRPLSLWISVILILDISVILSSLSTLTSLNFSNPSHLWKFFLFAVLLLASSSHAVCSLCFCLKLRKSIKSIRQCLMNLLVGKMVLHEQVYPLTSAFLQDLETTKTIGFFDLLPITRGFSAVVIFFSLFCSYFVFLPVL